MKKIILILLIVVNYSCERYEQPTLLSLSGEYIIDAISIKSNNGFSTYHDSLYFPPSIYINRNEDFPMDTIRVGKTIWHFDYSVISICSNPNPNYINYWNFRNFYDVINHQSNYNLGYIRFYCNGEERIFRILEDGFESLTLESSPQWGFAILPPGATMILYLRRIGP